MLKLEFVRRTAVVEGPLAFRMRRLLAARRGEHGLQIMSFPMLGARLAGGFVRPAQEQELDPAIQSALDAGGLEELEGIRELPGTRRALARTLSRAWGADLDIGALHQQSSRLSDLASIEERVRSALPPGVLTPRELRDAALARVEFAPAVLGQVELERLSFVPLVWRPLLAALSDVVDLSWRRPGTRAVEWFCGRVSFEELPPSAAWEVVSCAGPQGEVTESLRWARELIASGRARPEDVAITAAATSEWDEHFLALSASADLPIHFSHGLPALASWEGQACAALADVLVNGLSQDRVRRLIAHAAGRVPALEHLAGNWTTGIERGAALFEVEQWRSAFDRVSGDGRGTNSKSVLMPVIELLAKGVAVAAEAGDLLLDEGAKALWLEALRRAPASALEFSLQALRVPDGRDPGASIVWCPAGHLAGWPRPFVRLLGLTSRSWPRRDSEDPLCPTISCPDTWSILIPSRNATGASSRSLPGRLRASVSSPVADGAHKARCSPTVR